MYQINKTPVDFIKNIISVRQEKNSNIQHSVRKIGQNNIALKQMIVENDHLKINV